MPFKSIYVISIYIILVTTFSFQTFKNIICRCYDVANISWLQRELGSFIFGADIPSSTFEEALGYFREAESLRPKFYWFDYDLYYVTVLHFIIY